jgi:flagellar hook-associated protein 3 FlgL
MRISTSLYFDQSSQQMSTAQTTLNQDQAQLSSGKQLVQPSDDPDKTALINQIQSQLTAQTTYQSTLTTMTTRLTAQQTALKNATSTLSQIQTLATEAANGTLTSSNRQAVANEISGLRDQLLSLANTQDSEGNYLFSGSKMGTASFAANGSGQVVYQGDTSTMMVNVGDNRQLSMNMAGTDAFVNVQSTDAQGNKSTISFFQSLDNLVSAVKNSDTSGIQQGIAQAQTLQQGLDNGLAQVGTNQTVVNLQTTVLSQVVLNLQTSLSNTQDLDYNAAVTKMNEDQLALEAAQNSFAKVSQESLFKYLS